MARPASIIIAYSDGPKASTKRDSGGDKKVIASVPAVPAMNEPTPAMNSAEPALPLRAIS